MTIVEMAGYMLSLENYTKRVRPVCSFQAVVLNGTDGTPIY